MSGIESVILEALDLDAADAFCAASGDAHVGVCAADASASGFRGVVLSRVVPQPSTVDLLIAARDQGATTFKRATKSFSGYGGAHGGALSGPADAI